MYLSQDWETKPQQNTFQNTGLGIKGKVLATNHRQGSKKRLANNWNHKTDWNNQGGKFERQVPRMDSWETSSSYLTF